MTPVLEYAIVGLFLVAIAVLVAWYILHNFRCVTISWTIVQIGNNATVTIRSSRITKCEIITGRGNCNIHGSLCICNVANGTIIEACSYGTCRVITVR